MSALTLNLLESRDRLGLKGPRAAEWLVGQGMPVPAAANTWAQAEPTGAAVLVARLGQLEFFLEDGTTGTTLKRLSPLLNECPSGVCPVLREDWALHLGGERVHDALAQVCNVNFAALSLDSHPLIMTLMMGVAVLVVPQRAAGEESADGKPGVAADRGGAAERQYRIWCDPTFGPYLTESLGAVVIECGGRYTGASA